MPSQSSAIKMSGNAYRLLLTAVNVLEALGKQGKTFLYTYIFVELQSCTYAYNSLQFPAKCFQLLSYNLKILSRVQDLTF